MKKWIIILIVLQLFLVSCTSSNKYESADFIDKYSVKFPIVEDIISKFDNENFEIIKLDSEDPGILFSFTTELTYEDINATIMRLSEDFHKTYNTSLSGRGDMNDDGSFTYMTEIMENSNFILEITNINNQKKFLKDSKNIDGIRQIGNSNVFVKLHNK